MQNSRSSTELHNSVALLKGVLSLFDFNLSIALVWQLLRLYVYVMYVICAAMVIEKRKSVTVLIVKKTSFHLDILQPLELANNVQVNTYRVNGVAR